MGIPGSVHQQYAMVLALSNELRQQLIGLTLKQSYTLSKDELVLVFQSSKQSLTIRVVQQFQTCFLFFEATQPYRISNAQPCFEDIIGQSVQGIEQHPNNRSFSLSFGDKTQLVFKLYDGLVNILLFEEGVVTDMFRKNIGNDWDLSIQSFEAKAVPEMPVVKGFFVYKRMSIHPYYLSFEPQQDELITQSKSAMEAYTAFSKVCLNAYRFVSLKQQLVSSTKHQLDKTLTLLAEAKQSMDRNQLRISDEEVANIIMANLHLIQSNSVGVELFDFYRNQPIQVKLKKDLNAQQNAAYYYRKSKNRSIEITKHNERIADLEQKVSKLSALLLKLEAAVSFRELKPFVKESAAKEKQLPFRQFSAFGFDIWVGKSASNNDELTVRHSHKNDLWLHAKDVSGSHVLVKWKPGKGYPNEVIQAAAQLAAYYSKLKGSSLVPVAYTPKKFVRKPKGAEPGSVVVDKEEVIMVKPGMPA
jgi:predicted ribosome quality control (RQC) complex YloA/Tae2 family protein